jgi:phage/plasmid-like protein (TIGR03299 family)
MAKNTDITILGNGGSVHANEKHDGPVPFDRVRSLFDFKVEYTPLYTHDAFGDSEKLPNRQAIRRTDTGLILNTVSKSHGLHQFSDVLVDNLFTLLDASDNDLQVSGAGLLKNGAVGWVQVQAPCLEAGEGDVAPTLTLASSHDGSLATSYRMGMFRFICSNQIGALRRKSDNVFKLRHTLNSSMNFTTARNTLGLMWKQAESFNEEVNTLINLSVTDTEFYRIVNRLAPMPPESATEAARTRWENRVESVSNIYRNDERVGDFRGTGWGVVQAFNTYRQHERPFRANGTAGTTSRLGRTMGDFLSGAIDLDDQKVTAAVFAESARKGL